MDKQSVTISVDRLFLAKIISDTVNGLVYDTPDAIPGVTEITVTRNSSKVSHYSDGGPSEVLSQDGDTSLAVNLDGLDGEMTAKYLSTYYDKTTGLQADGWGRNTPYSAIGYRSELGNGKFKYTWFYKGAFTKPDEGASTKTASVTPQTKAMAFMAVEPQYTVREGYNLKQSILSSDPNLPNGVNDSVLNDTDSGWFSSPLYIPHSTGTQISDLAVTTGGSGEIDLTFTKPEGATSVVVQVETLVGWIVSTTSAILTADSALATITGLTEGNAYKCRLLVTGGTYAGTSNEVTGTAGA